MATITWGGTSGVWSFAASWRQLKLPGTADTASFLAVDRSMVTIDAPATAHAITVAAGSGVALLVQDTLTLTGALTLAGGTLALQPGGTIVGGTVDLAGGALDATGGVIDGTVLIGDLGQGLTVTAATIAATTKASGTAPLAVVGTLDLASDSYDNAVLSLHPFAKSAADELDVASFGLVVLGPKLRVTLSQDDPAHTPDSNPSGPPPVIGGAGTIENTGTLVSDATSATIESSGFINTGQMNLINAVVLGETQVFLGGTQLTWSATLAPTLALTSAQFENDGTLTASGATVEARGASFVNTGLIDLGTATAEGPVAISQPSSSKTAPAAPQEQIGTLTLASTLDIGSEVTSFSNTGIMAATRITFDGTVNLADLGTLRGTVVFTGTLDLGGGTLDAASLPSATTYVLKGTVQNGTILDTDGSIDTTGATLVDTALLFSQPTTLTDLTGPATVVLDANTADLAYTTSATIDDLTVTAGAPGITDGLSIQGGRLTFGTGTTITDTVIGTSLAIDGGDFVEHGTVTLAGSKLEIATLDGTGTISLSADAVLTIDSLASGAAVTVAFGAGTSALILPGDSSGSGTLGLKITGLAAGDLLDFTGVSDDPGTVFAEAGAAISDGRLLVQGASGDQASVTTNAAGLTFSADTDPNGGTIISVACFRHGTNIATPHGEMPVESLSVGDAVLTWSGDTRRIRWLGRRAYKRALVARQRQLRPVRLAAGVLGFGLPRRPLYLSPLHGLLIDGLLVPVGVLVNGRTITRAAVADVAYVHIELDSPDLLLAEGTPSESFVDCDNRDMFQNAHEVAAAGRPSEPPKWSFPVPRVEEGWALEAIRARLAAAAGPTPPAASGGALRGHLDTAGPDHVAGWVFDETTPNVPVTAELVAGDATIAYLVANRYRIDLDIAGIGCAAHGFTASLPPLAPSCLARLALVRLSDGARLGSPRDVG